MEGNLKILMTADTVGGVWTYAMDLCEAFLDYKVKIHLVTMGALLKKDQYEQLRELDNIELYESNYKLEWMHEPWDDVEKARQWIASIYAKVKPDIIHFNNFGQVAGEWNCPVITVYHSCVQTWWYAVKGEDPPKEWERYNVTLENALEKSDMIVAPSISMLEQAQEVFGHFKVSEVIYNGKNLEANYLSKKESYILSAGRIWDEGKNIRLLSEIAGVLSWPLYLAGNSESPDGQIYEPENVIFMGQLSQAEMEQCMSKASIFVMPSKYEPFGLAVLEAAKSGCALALSDIDTFREIWGDAAVYFNPADSADAAQVINNLISDKSLREEKAAKAAIRAKDFTAENMAGQYMQLYAKLIKKDNLL